MLTNVVSYQCNHPNCTDTENNHEIFISVAPGVNAINVVNNATVSFVFTLLESGIDEISVFREVANERHDISIDIAFIIRDMMTNLIDTAIEDINKLLD